LVLHFAYRFRQNTNFQLRIHNVVFVKPETILGISK